MSDDTLLLTVPEAAKLLRISRNLAYDLVARGEIPAIRLGRVIRVPRGTLERWLSDGPQGAERPAVDRSAGSPRIGGSGGASPHPFD